MGMLAHGCIGESVIVRQILIRQPNIDNKDTLTSKFSTLPYDDEKMQKMISLVQNAKSTSLCNNGDKAR